MDATDHVQRLASRLRLDPEVRAHALQLCEDADVGDAAVEPAALAAAALSVSSALRGNAPPETRIARAAGVADAVLAAHVRHLAGRLHVPHPLP